MTEIIERLAAEFHDADRVLVEAAVRVAHLRLSSQPTARISSAMVERIARIRLHTFAV